MRLPSAHDPVPTARRVTTTRGRTTDADATPCAMGKAIDVEDVRPCATAKTTGLGGDRPCVTTKVTRLGSIGCGSARRTVPKTAVCETRSGAVTSRGTIRNQGEWKVDRGAIAHATCLPGAKHAENVGVVACKARRRPNVRPDAKIAVRAHNAVMTGMAKAEMRCKARIESGARTECEVRTRCGAREGCGDRIEGEATGCEARTGHKAAAGHRSDGS
ncbi:MAG: hypothetical protein ABII12_11180 [Planctomycetota bacterium]